jgi:hypothetical protein
MATPAAASGSSISTVGIHMQWVDWHASLRRVMGYGTCRTCQAVHFPGVHAGTHALSGNRAHVTIDGTSCQTAARLLACLQAQDWAVFVYQLPVQLSAESSMQPLSIQTCVLCARTHPALLHCRSATAQATATIAASTASTSDPMQSAGTPCTACSEVEQQ